MYELQSFVDGQAAGRAVPVAESWRDEAQPVHHELVRQMLRALPGRGVTEIAGHEGADSWMALNDGPDGHGSWTIPRDPEAARVSVARCRRDRWVGLRRRLVLTLRRWADQIERREGRA